LRATVLAVAVGIYLPFTLSVPIFAGGLIAQDVTQRIQATSLNGNGLLVAAGLITGEALVGILLAVPIAVSGDANVLALPALWQLDALAGSATGILALLVAGGALLKASLVRA